MWRRSRVRDERFLLHGSHRKSSPNIDEMGYDDDGGGGSCGGVIVAFSRSTELTAYESFVCRDFVVRRPDDGKSP